jgi:lipopolysaccharide transport system ATP-binding protein
VTSAVVVDHVSKAFKRVVLRTGYTTFKTALAQRFNGRSSAVDYVQALRDVSLSIPRGATVGIVGRNGSGKSTLLRTIAGIYRPDTGRVVTRGRVCTLIELGAGFHPEFSGRENICINGLVLGLSKREIMRRVDDIIRFAELEEFIDAPLRTYSSGMYMRLGFSVAVHADPDVLLVDEVIAVGDEGFVKKCLSKMDEFKRVGKTIVVAGHDLLLMERWCDAAVFLEAGRVRAQGPPSDVIAAYRRSLVEAQAGPA